MRKRNWTVRFGDGFGLLGTGGGWAVSVVYCSAKGGSCPMVQVWPAPTGGSDYGERGGPGQVDTPMLMTDLAPEVLGGDDQSHPGPGWHPRRSWAVWWCS